MFDRDNLTPKQLERIQEVEELTGLPIEKLSHSHRNSDRKNYLWQIDKAYNSLEKGSSQMFGKSSW